MSLSSTHKKIIAIAIVVAAACIAFVVFNNQGGASGGGGLSGGWEPEVSGPWNYNHYHYITAALEFSSRNFTLTGYFQRTHVRHEGDHAFHGYHVLLEFGDSDDSHEFHEFLIRSLDTTNMSLIEELTISHIQHRLYRYEIRGTYRISDDGRIELVVNNNAAITNFSHNVDSFANTETMTIAGVYFTRAR